jgi:hypothetical protein
MSPSFERRRRHLVKYDDTGNSASPLQYGLVNKARPGNEGRGMTDKFFPGSYLRFQLPRKGVKQTHHVVWVTGTSAPQVSQRPATSHGRGVWAFLPVLERLPRPEVPSLILSELPEAALA